MDDNLLFESIAGLYASVALGRNDSDPDTTQSFSPECSSHSKRDRMTWTLEEDRAIVEAVQKYGFKWRLIARELGTGSDDAIRNRVLRMDPSLLPSDVRRDVDNMKKSVKNSVKNLPSNKVEHRSYTREEDLVIMEEMKHCSDCKCRMSWKKLAAGPIASRTPQSIRNRAYRILAKRERHLR